MDEIELHRHLVTEHGVPAGFIETTDYTQAEWKWEHACYHNGARDRTVDLLHVHDDEYVLYSDEDGACGRPRRAVHGT